MCFVFGKLNLQIRCGAAKIVWIRGGYGGIAENKNPSCLRRVSENQINSIKKPLMFLLPASHQSSQDTKQILPYWLGSNIF